ncbi:MAG: pyridoxamine 5'-phosphate oxidase family protein [Clostridia bacterium]|nr:pyridoxamine 5'-phosphate oxidase family protein [Clostridia bacterium]
MRRSDRQVTDDNKIDEIIRRCTSIRLGFNDNGKVYIVPMSFGFCRENGERVFYFHSASSGRKIDLIKASDYASFQMDCDGRIYGEDTACTYTTSFKSIFGEGRTEILEEKEDKLKALNVLMAQYTEKSDWTFDERYLPKMCVFRLTVTELSCKEHE